MISRNPWKLLPPLLARRLENIFSQEEILQLQEVFAQETRPVTFSLSPCSSHQQEIEKILLKHHISYTLADIFTDAYILDAWHRESDIWKLDIYKEGKIYLQGLSSQLPVHFFSPLSSSSWQKILDACAAPWWKTLQLAKKFPQAEIWVCDSHPIRSKKLIYNLTKFWIVSDRIHIVQDVVQNIGKYISSWSWKKSEFFDTILIDAPCSSEWSINVHHTAFLEKWDISHIKKNAIRQKDICNSLIPYLKEWWEMIYSTCTLAPEENEGVIDEIITHHNNVFLEAIHLPDTPLFNIIQGLKNFEQQSFNPEISTSTLRIIPNKFSEWFYIAKLKK